MITFISTRLFSAFAEGQAMNGRAGGMRAMGPQMGGPQVEAFMRDFGGAAMRPMQTGRAAQGGVSCHTLLALNKIDDILLLIGRLGGRI